MHSPVSLMGVRLLERVRSITFATLGSIARVGLGLIAFVLQQGWPSVLGGPLPVLPGERSHGEATATAPLSPGGGTTRAPHSQKTSGAVPPTRSRGADR